MSGRGTCVQSTFFPNCSAVDLWILTHPPLQAWITRFFNCICKWSVVGWIQHVFNVDLLYFLYNYHKSHSQGWTHISMFLTMGFHCACVGLPPDSTGWKWEPCLRVGSCFVVAVTHWHMQTRMHTWIIGKSWERLRSIRDVSLDLPFPPIIPRMSPQTIHSHQYFQWCLLKTFHSHPYFQGCPLRPSIPIHTSRHVYLDLQFPSILPRMSI